MDARLLIMRKSATSYAGWLKRNTAKRNIMNTANLDIDVRQANRLDDMLDQKHIFNIVDQAIPVHYREDWIRFVNSLRLPKARRQHIIEMVKKILEEHDVVS